MALPIDKSIMDTSKTPKRRVVEGISIRVLMFEAGGTDESVLRELLLRLSEQPDFQMTDLSRGTDSRSNFGTEVLSFPNLEIHVKEQNVYKNGKLVPLSHYEFFTLCFLAKHPGWVFTKQQIYEAVWQEPEKDGRAAITNVISQIRKKLHPNDPKNGYIKTVVNSGYKFEA